MLNKKLFVISLYAFLINNIRAQSVQNLRDELQKIIYSKNATVGLSIKGIEDKDTLAINGNMRMPLMSVFKFHIALAVLDKVDQKKLALDQKIFIKKEDLLPNTWSPMRDDFPEGNMYFTLDKILRYTVSHSDNNGCDILLKLIGGTDYLQKYINRLGIKDFTVKVNEQQMQDWNDCYLNTSTALATTKLLELFYNNQILTQDSTKYLYQIMIETSRGLTWLKGGIPQGTAIAHRTGISDTNENGLRIAMNDVGIITLPNGKHYIITVYLKDIMEKREDTERLISDISQSTWNYFIKKIK